VINDLDIKKLKTVFTTKDDLEKLELRVGDSFISVQEQFDHVQEQFDHVQEQLDDLKTDVSDIKNHMITMEDNILGALSRLQSENVVTSSYRPKIEDHEQRITKVEKAIFSN
jgi:chromosome segregation ATPase